MTVAITGATGFLGLRLLPLLLARNDQVVVLAHAGTAPAMDRILGHFRASGLPTAPARDLTVLNIDVTRPCLGLPQWQFRALAEQLTEVWHCAALTDLTAPAEHVRPVNVTGTGAVLELAAAGPSMLYHVSTAFVAGRRRTGLIGEGDLDGSYGFENPYEESKFHGERAVHDWSRRHGRPAMIIRPSVLFTDRPSLGSATHPLSTVFRLSDVVQTLFGPERRTAERMAVPILAEPDAHVNVIPVEQAASLMLELADRIPPSGVHTAHVTYPHEVPIATLFALIEERYPVKLEPMPVVAQDFKPLSGSSPERPELSFVAARLSGFAPYCLHRRHYDCGAIRAAGLDLSNAPPLDVDYLLAGI